MRALILALILSVGVLLEGCGVRTVARKRRKVQIPCPCNSYNKNTVSLLYAATSDHSLDWTGTFGVGDAFGSLCSWTIGQPFSLA